MKNILVPTDFSDNAFKALCYAADIAGRSGAVVHLLHTCTLLESPFVDRKAMRDAYNEQRLRETKAGLLRVKQDAEVRFPGVAFRDHLFVGPTEASILQYASDHAVDLIVMGTQGATGLAEVLVGSVAAAIVAESPVPVVCVPKAFPGDMPALIALATRKFEAQPALVDPVFELASLYGARVQVLLFEDADADAGHNVAHAMQLDDYVLHLRQRYPGVEVRGEIVDGTEFEDAMQAYCDQHAVGLMAMFTYRRSFWQKLWQPSLTRQMAYHTTIPLLAIPAGELE